jgi:ATP-dependent Clp protease ATP-binding subunit ClpC
LVVDQAGSDGERRDHLVMFEGLSEQGRAVLVRAEAEARALNHNYVGSESLLLGLLADDRSAAAQLLGQSGLTLELGRAEVAQRVGASDEELDVIALTPRAKSVLEAAERESQRLGATLPGPEHILLGIALEDDGMAMKILRDFDLDAKKIREDVARLLTNPNSA